MRIWPSAVWITGLDLPDRRSTVKARRKTGFPRLRFLAKLRSGQVETWMSVFSLTFPTMLESKNEREINPDPEYQKALQALGDRMLDGLRKEDPKKRPLIGKLVAEMEEYDRIQTEGEKWLDALLELLGNDPKNEPEMPDDLAHAIEEQNTLLDRLHKRIGTAKNDQEQLQRLREFNVAYTATVPLFRQMYECARDVMAGLKKG